MIPKLDSDIQLTELMAYMGAFYIFDVVLGYSVVTLAGYAFPAQLQLFLNQRLNGFFSLPSYLVSQIFSDLPLLTAYCLLTSLIIYVSFGVPLLLPANQYINPKGFQKQHCDRLFANQTKLYGISYADDKYEQTLDIFRAAEHFEIQSQSQLVWRFVRYFTGNLGIFLTAQTSGMIVGAFLWFSLNASVFISCIMVSN